MSRPSSGYDYTFVRVEDFDYAKEISIAETCNDSVKTLFPLKDKLTTLNMCLNRISRGDSSQPRSGARMQPTAQAVGSCRVEGNKPRTGRKKIYDKITEDSCVKP